MRAACCRAKWAASVLAPALVAHAGSALAQQAPGGSPAAPQAASSATSPFERVSRLGEYRGYAPVLYPGRQRASMYLTLRDGTRLAMDLHRPLDASGQPVATPLPVVWQHALSRRAPSDTRITALTRRVPELVKHGYVVAEVERRGLGASFGARRGYNDRTEARDAYEVTEWLARQPWSTGQVGVIGCSNTGDAAMHAASYAPPSLKAVMAGCFSWSKYDGFLRGGVPAQWGVGPEQPLEQQLRTAFPVDGDDERTLLKLAIEQHRDATPLAAMWRAMPYRDSWSDLVASRFWLEGSVATHRDALQRSGAAFYIFGGWQDDFRREGLVAWANLQRTNPARVLIGPWLHCLHPDFDLVAEALRFFDRYLKGVDNGIDREPPIQLHAVGAAPAQAWQGFAQWPPVAASALVQRLQIDPAATPGSGHTLRTLAADAAAAGRVGVVGRGDRGAVAATSAPARRDGRRLARPDAVNVTLAVQPPAACREAGAFTIPCSPAAGLRFSGPVLSADTQLTGHPLLGLWVSSPQPEQAVFAYLEDVAPDGHVTVVSEGRLKASLRALHRPPYDFLGLPWTRSLEADHQPLAAGVPVKLDFDFLPLSHVFKAGHRWRLVITGNDPRERPASPTGHALSVWSDAQRPSTITLPVMRDSASASAATAIPFAAAGRSP